MTNGQVIAAVKLSCGRTYLEVAGIAIAMQGDTCRATLPEECLDQIPESELQRASIGDESAKDLPVEVVRFFRGDRWTIQMLEYVANKINKCRGDKCPTR